MKNYCLRKLKLMQLLRRISEIFIGHLPPMYFIFDANNEKLLLEEAKVNAVIA